MSRNYQGGRGGWGFGSRPYSGSGGPGNYYGGSQTRWGQESPRGGFGRGRGRGGNSYSSSPNNWNGGRNSERDRGGQSPAQSKKGKGKGGPRGDQNSFADSKRVNVFTETLDNTNLLYMTVDDSLRKILIEILDRYYLTGRYPSPYLALVTIAGHISANNGQGACDVATLTKKQIEQLVDNNLGSNAGAVKAALEVICSPGGDKEVDGALRNFSEYYLKPTPVKGGQTGPALACLQIMTSKPDLVVRVTKNKRAAVGSKLKTLIHAQPFSVSSIANLTKATEGVVQDQVSDDISASLAEMKSQMDRVLIHLEETNREGSDSDDDDEEEEGSGTTGLAGAPTSSTK